MFFDATSTSLKALQTHYRRDDEALFGALPNLKDLPAEASSLASVEEQQASSRLTNAQCDAVNRVSANLGQAFRPESQHSRSALNEVPETAPRTSLHGANY